MGTSFCHVKRIVKLFQDIFLAIEINHWNNGAAALFRIKEETMIILIVLNSF